MYLYRLSRIKCVRFVIFVLFAADIGPSRAISLSVKGGQRANQLYSYPIIISMGLPRQPT